MSSFLHVVAPDTALPTAGSLDTLQAADTTPTVIQTGTRYRGTPRLPPTDGARPDVGYYCTLPLPDRSRARNFA